MKQEKWRAFFWQGPGIMLISSVFFALMGVFVKLASSTLPAPELAFARFAFGMAAVWVLSRMGLASLESRKKKLLILRGVLGGTAILLFYLAIANGTLTNATVLNSAYPIFATIFAAFYIKERLSPFIVLPLAASMAGIVLLTHPDFGHIKIGDLFALISAVVGGGAVVTIRELRKTESTWAVFFYFSMLGAVFSGIIMLPDFVIPSWRDALFMFLAAVFAMAGQLLVTRGFKYSSAAVGSVLSMTSVVFSALFAVIFFGENLSLGEGAGAILIILGSTFLAAFSPGEGKKVSLAGKNS